MNGVVFSKQDRYDEALNCLLTASECDRSSPLPHSSMAAIYSALGDRDGAARHYHTAVQLAPRRPNVLLNYAMFLHKHGPPVCSNHLIGCVIYGYYGTYSLLH